MLTFRNLLRGYLCNTPNPPEVPFMFGSNVTASFEYKEISSYICEYEYQCGSEPSETLSGDA